METVFKADIFFFITGTVVLVAGILIAIILWYLVRIFKDLKKISTIVQEETENIASDVRATRTQLKTDLKEIHSQVKSEGKSILSIIGFLTGKAKRKRKK